MNISAITSQKNSRQEQWPWTPWARAIRQLIKLVCKDASLLQLKLQQCWKSCPAAMKVGTQPHTCAWGLTTRYARPASPYPSPHAHPTRGLLCFTAAGPNWPCFRAANNQVAWTVPKGRKLEQKEREFPLTVSFCTRSYL